MNCFALPKRAEPGRRGQARQHWDLGLRTSEFTPHELLVAAILASLFLVHATTLTAAAGDPYSIVNSKHNLSISGPGTVRANTETEICIFCHAPHSKGGQIPLWNREDSHATYTPYTSTTLKATLSQPTGSSKLCLSCHDGTIALGMVRNRSTPIQMRNSVGPMPVGPTRLGTDLSGHHPISFTYDNALVTADGELRDPTTLQQQVRLDHDKQVQCTSCHDPHRNQFGKFLVVDNTASALCLDCHAPTLWNNSAHAISRATWNGSGQNPWPHTTATTVAANACENCHTPHAAGTKPRLLNFAKVEDNCLVCHNGTVAVKNLASEFNKASVHPVLTTSSLHDAAESIISPNGRHAACMDCHNPHATTTTAAQGSGLPGTLAQVKGESMGGAALTVASHEYEVCFRCHAESGNLNGSKVLRQFSQPNTRLQFNAGNSSYHPVVATAKSVQDHTLLSPWSAAAQILCSDCHNNDQGPGAKGTGPNGPHGSAYAPILERNLNQMDLQPESSFAYALCYKCHSESVLMGDQLHGKHVRDHQTACSTCHDAHGVQNQPHLMNFNTLYVTPANGRISYSDQGSGHDACTLTCHGSIHNNKSY
jgi:predicted CXXCH cytochrome family protein